MGDGLAINYEHLAWGARSMLLASTLNQDEDQMVTCDLLLFVVPIAAHTICIQVEVTAVTINNLGSVFTRTFIEVVEIPP